MSYYKLIPAIPQNNDSNPTTHWVNTDVDEDLNYNIMRLQLMYDIEDVEVIEIGIGEFDGRRGHKKKL